MTIKNTIYSSLVLNGNERTAAQFAAHCNTTVNSVTSRISELRRDGFVIYANRRTDTKGRTKTFYRHGKPTRSLISAAYSA